MCDIWLNFFLKKIVFLHKIIHVDFTIRYILLNNMFHLVVEWPRPDIPTLSSPQPQQCSVHSCYKLPRSPQNTRIPLQKCVPFCRLCLLSGILVVETGGRVQNMKIFFWELLQTRFYFVLV